MIVINVKDGVDT